MPGWVTVLLGVAGGIAVVWIALVAALWWHARRTGSHVDWPGVLRLVPDVIRLVRRLVADPDVPRATRWWLVGLLGYLLLPIDLIPDVIPVLGYADDAVVVVIVLRLAVRQAGPESIERHWPGTPDGLHSVLALTGHRPSPLGGPARSTTRAGGRTPAE